MGNFLEDQLVFELKSTTKIKICS